MRLHLEHDRLPLLTRITASTATTEFGEAVLTPPPVSLRPAASEESWPLASNSVEAELNPASTRNDPPPRSGTWTCSGTDGRSGADRCRPTGHYPQDSPLPGWNAAEQLAALEDG